MLRVLRLEECKIEKLSPLTSAPLLRELYLKNNDISDFATLASLTCCEELEILDLSLNPIEAEEQKIDLFCRLLFKKFQVNLELIVG
jgi:Leucine-rich repeat (LRR) protein